MPTGEVFPTTEDRFLGGRVEIRQPVEGYRAGIDPILLAAAVSAKPGESALDLGCGVGTAALCLLARLPQLTVTALELQPHLVELARGNAAANGMADRLMVEEGTLTSPPEPLRDRLFDHVLTNPPWLDPATSRAPASASKAICHVEAEVGLAAWLAVAVRLLKRKGRLAVIHRADRLGDLLGALDGLPVGEIRVRPIWPRAGRPAIRVIVTARKEVKTPLELLPGLVLHDEQGKYTDAAEAVLRRAAALQ